MRNVIQQNSSLHRNDQLETERSYSDLKRSGRPKKATLRDDHLMKRIVV